MSAVKAVVLGGACLLSCMACSGGDESSIVSNTLTGEAEAPTYHQDVAPIFNAKCTGCHQEGGVGPFVLTDYEPARARAGQIAAYTADRIMPPFLVETGGSCGSFDESIALTDAEIATIGSWAELGAAEGTEVAVTPRPLPVLEGATDFELPTFAPEVMGGPLAEFDEYRCFPIEHGLTADQFVTGYDVLPGNTAIVHHVLAFIVDPSRVVDGRSNAEVMQALDDESPDRIGWPCFGMAGDGVEVESAPVIWAPGQGVVSYPRDLGVSFKRDRALVAQVHYNLADGTPASATDQTKVRLRLESSVTRQGIFLLADDLLRGLADGVPQPLPAGRESVVVEWTRQARELGLPEGLPTELVGLFPHMHERGRKYLFELANDGDFECQGRVNRWDFNWQRIYDYAEPIPFDADTRVRVTCDYDTRDATAPIMPGWGTRNEMCFVMTMLALPPGLFL